MLPLSRITADDHGGKVVLAAALMLAYTILVAATRFQTKWPWRKSNIYSEDYLLLASIITCIAHTVVIAFAVQHGFGRHAHGLSKEQRQFTEKAILSSIVTARVAESLSLASLTAFLKKLSGDVVHQRLLGWTYIVIGLWTCAAVMVGAIELNSIKISVTVSRVLGSLLPAVLGIHFAITMHMIWSTPARLLKKLVATIWLSFLLGIAAFIAARITLTPSPTLEGDFSFDNVRFSILMSIEVNLCVIGASYVSLLKFANNATTGFMGQVLSRRGSVYEHSSSAKGPKLRLQERMQSSLDETDDEMDIVEDGET